MEIVYLLSNVNRQKWVVHNSHGDSEFHCIIPSWAIQFRLSQFKKLKWKTEKKPKIENQPLIHERSMEYDWLMSTMYLP